jgi:hypothetical protein
LECSDLAVALSAIDDTQGEHLIDVKHARRSPDQKSARVFSQASSFFAVAHPVQERFELRRGIEAEFGNDIEVR